MKKLFTTDNGGFPFELDDLRWIGRGIDESFESFTKAFAKNDTGDYVLFGCVVSNIVLGANSLTYDITSGAIVINGEICLVESATGVTVTDPSFTNFYFDIDDTSFDATGNESFEDSSVHDTYQNRFAKIVGGSSLPTDRISYSQTTNHTLASKIATLIENETFNFNRFIKFGASTSTITSANSSALQDKNFVVVDFDGTVPAWKCGSIIATSKIGTVVFVKFNATGSPSDTMLINHDDATATAGRARFLTSTKNNVVVGHGDVISAVFDGTYWNLLSEPKRSWIDDTTTTNWITQVNGTIVGSPRVMYKVDQQEKTVEINGICVFDVAGGTSPSIGYKLPNIQSVYNHTGLYYVSCIGVLLGAVARFDIYVSGGDTYIIFRQGVEFIPVDFNPATGYVVQFSHKFNIQ